MSFLSALSLLLVALKLTGYTDMAWWVVFLPFAIEVIIEMVFIVPTISESIDELKDKK